MNVGEGYMLKVTFAQLKQFMEFVFPSGNDGAMMSQNTFGATLRIRGGDIVKFFEISGYRIDAKSKDFGTQMFTINTATLYELWSDPRKVAGLKTTGQEATAHILVSEKGNISLELTG
jgi:hypothetical protein